MMKLCYNGHDRIVHDNPHGCPLCNLRIHNDGVHDFIESKGLEKELVQFLHDINTEQEEQTK